jgi:diacylglycerol kinase (ATP)
LGRDTTAGAPPRAPRTGLLVYNPLAGGRRRARTRGIVERAKARGLELTEWPTSGPGSATEIVKRNLAAAPDVVVVAGGDGTVGDVAAALLGTPVPLAILPTGTVNVVAREYRLGKDLGTAERHLLSPRTRPLTVWRAMGRTCLIGMGVGFDARVMKNTVPLLKRLFGRTGIGWTATLEWLKYEFPPIAVEGMDADGRPFCREATFVVAANLKRYGGDPVMSPYADPEDELLDVVFFASRSRATLIRFYHHLSRGRAEHLRDEGVSRLAVRSLMARSLAGYELDVQVDGDAAGATPATIGPALGRVQIVVPG